MVGVVDLIKKVYVNVNLTQLDQNDLPMILLKRNNSGLSRALDYLDEIILLNGVRVK